MELLPGEVWQVSKRYSQYFRSYLRKTTGGALWAPPPPAGRGLVVTWDSGANVSLITHKAASMFNLKGHETKLTITKVENETQDFKSKRYVVPLIDANEKLWEVHAYGIKEITSALDKSRRFFSGIAIP